MQKHMHAVGLVSLGE